MDNINIYIKSKMKNKKVSINVKNMGNDIYTGLKEIITKKRTINEKNEIVKEFYQYEESNQKKHSMYSDKEKGIFIGLLILILHIVTLTILYVYSFRMLRETVISNFAPYLIFMSAAPFLVWLISTNENFWAFHKRKRVFFYLCCINLLMTLLQPVYTLFRNLAVGAVSGIPTNEVLTYRMIKLLAYIIIIILMTIFMIVLYTQIEPLLTNQSLKRQIEIFKLKQVHDDRDDREYKYDLTIIKDLDSGNPIVIKENDRLVQTELNGASGTGKTSSIFTTGTAQDMDTKLKNREKRQEAYLQLIKEGKATLKGPLMEFDENAIVAIGKNKAALERNEKEIYRIKKRYQDCGITVIAPNASLNEDIIRLAQARGMKINVLDPVNDYSGYSNVRKVGINPFFIPLGLSENERLIRISNTSTVFAEVLIATNQMGGESDPYFTDISLSVCSNVSTIIMLAKNIRGKQAYFEDVQECINDFRKLRNYIDIIEKHYDIYVDSEGSKKGALTGDDIDNNKKKGKEKEARKNPYYLQIFFVKQELLGAGADDMFSQSRGLRNLINKVVLDPRIKAKLSADEENSINFDKILENNEITVVNTAIELGKETSTSFGLFFLLLHKISVLRRPMNTRTLHILRIDEATQYMHPCYEDMIALYRQFKCAVEIAIQSLSQTEKSRATAYLKDVFLGAGTHIVFGRLTPDEMKLYSEMGGINRQVEEQVSQTSSSILTSNPNFTEGIRKTNSVSNVLEGADMRILDFQELTIFTIDNGRVLPGKLARVFFINKSAFDKKNTRNILWERVVPEAFVTGKRSAEKEEEGDSVLSSGLEEAVKVRTHVPGDAKEEILVQKNIGVSKICEHNYNNMSASELYNLLSGVQEENNIKDAEVLKNGQDEKNRYIPEDEDYHKYLNQMNQM